FGIIVDGAVILVEHIYERSDRSRTGVLAIAKEVARPTLFSLLIIIAAYLPIFALQRVEGRIFGPMAHTVVSALVGAMLVSFTLVPVLCVLGLGRTRHSPVLAAARRAYDPGLLYAMRRPGVTLTLAAGALLAAGVLAGRLGSEFLPELNEGGLYLHFGLPPTL